LATRQSSSHNRNTDMIQKLSDFYEQHPAVFSSNPCDADARWWLKPVGRALAWFSTECPCCSGSRVLLAALAGAIFPTVTLAALGGLLLGRVIKEYIRPTE
jgi:hypothetical protein